MQLNYSKALVQTSSLSPSPSPYNNNISTDNGTTTDDGDDKYVGRTGTLSGSPEELIVKKIKSRKDYLVSNNVSNIIDLDDTDNMWILPSGINFSVSFISRRNDLIRQCEANQEELQVDEELSVNGIILLDADLISNIVKEDVYEEACNVVESFFNKFSNTNNEPYLDYIFNFCMYMTKGKFEDAENYINSSSLPYYIKSILFSLKFRYSKCYSTDLVNESTAVKDSIVPLLDSYFPNTKKITRKRSIDMDPSLSKHVRKADFSIVSNSSNHLILALETKSIKSQNKSANDLTNMARYMKDTIDDIESDGFKTVSIIGIIASGNTISTYIMTHSHDYLYYFYKLAKNYIATDYHDMCRIIPIFSVFDQLKNIVTETSNILSTLPHNRTTENNLKKLKTYRTPKERIKRVNLNTDDARRTKRRLHFD
ncbi:hypothetical protein BDF21DRAFT_498372 [Thamnidium elegans]|uniref:Uncharacterized protein n=1 Tax=Thamnidium elegans TaxID=101142 RepID=A0A8H7SHP4_9FUNG|nr:hypothetical protein INT48_002480 [Thamnidium elegans]KAI8051870.1 hypothetical protein BDF21DRAFT_498372 [Thamnidium elegans]